MGGPRAPYSRQVRCGYEEGLRPAAKRPLKLYHGSSLSRGNATGWFSSDDL